MKNKYSIVLLASGSGSLAQAIFDADLDLEIIALISDQDSPALSRAKEAEVPAFYLPIGSDRAAWNTELIAVMKELKPDLVVSVGFMRILSAEFVQIFRTINTHPALLPQFPGAHAVRDALAAGSTQTGATVHWVDEGVDTGEVIRQVSVPILAGDSESSLHERIKIAERELIVETLAELISGA